MNEFILKQLNLDFTQITGCQLAENIVHLAQRWGNSDFQWDTYLLMTDTKITQWGMWASLHVSKGKNFFKLIF